MNRLILSVLAAVAAVSASPAAAAIIGPHPVYQLRAVTASASSISGRYLSVDTSGSVGIFGGSATAPKQFYAAGNNATASVEFHTLPIGIVDHALALVGGPGAGLLHLQDVANPSAAQPPVEGGVLDWQSFQLGPGPSKDPNVPSEEAQARSIGESALVSAFYYAGSKGRWLALQRAEDEYTVAWYDDNSIITQNYLRIDIAYDVVEE